MLIENALILGRDDMFDSDKSKSIMLVDFSHFKVSRSDMNNISIVIFIDYNGQTKILKNRFGDNGAGRFIDTINDMKNNSLDNGLGYGEQYFNDIIELYS